MSYTYVKEWKETIKRIGRWVDMKHDYKGNSGKTILSVSKVYDYVINPYRGCRHGCTYCYARFMKRFTGHKEPWGEFVDVKVNASQLLRKQLKKAKQGIVALSTVTDPYQPIERKYELTRRCLEALLDHQFQSIY
jgi:DNA repair photolyase